MKSCDLRLKSGGKIAIICWFLVAFCLLPIRVLAQDQEVSQEDMDKYTWEKEVVINISPQADDLRERLSSEIQKMVAAGHLAPYRMAATESNYGTLYFWFHAGEPIYTLSEALKYLPESDTQTKQALQSYLQQEITDYPPYVPTAVCFVGDPACQAPWLSPDEGARREYYPIEDTTSLAYVTHVYQKIPSIQTFYHLWNYVDVTGDTQLVIDHWTQIEKYFNKIKDRLGEEKAWRDRGGCVAKYGDISGCVGMARLAYLIDQQATEDEATVRLSEGFNNGLDFVQFEENSYNESRHFIEDGGDDANLKSKEVRSYVFLNLFPETSRYLREYNLQAVSDHLNTLSWNIPSWYTTYGPGFVGGEVSFTTPLVSYPMFQAYAQVLDQEPEWLRQRLDVPLAKIGDLYYIQNLVSTIKAYGQTCWEDIRTGEQVCEDQGGFLLGDVDHDNDVDKDDALVVLGNYNKNPLVVNNYYDPVSDSKVNAIDFGYVWKDWGK